MFCFEAYCNHWLQVEEFDYYKIKTVYFLIKTIGKWKT